MHNMKTQKIILTNIFFIKRKLMSKFEIKGF